MKRYALPHQDGTISIMQLIADHPVEHEIARSVFSSPVILDGVTEVTEEEAAAIRAQRPKPEAQASSSPVSGPSSTDILIIQQENADLKDEMARLRQDLERQLAEFPLRLAELISNAKAQEQ
jgi:hypothetical protein